MHLENRLSDFNHLNLTRLTSQVTSKCMNTCRPMS